jgi:maltose O-acetyltransferase
VSSFKTYLAGNRWVKLTVNHAYAYVIHLVHAVLNLMPWFVRNPCFRLMLGRAGRHVFIDHDVYMKFPWLVEIGDDASINRGASFYPAFFGEHRIILGNNVRIAPGVRLHAAGHDIGDLAYPDAGGPITVEDDVWIGAGAIILPGVTIGARSVVGAGAVVTRDVPRDSVAVGVPAQCRPKQVDAQ